MPAPPFSADCLVLNWALPCEALPVPPAPLSYDRRIGDAVDYAFVSVRIGWDCRCRLPGLARPRLDAPRLDLAFAVVGGDRRRGWWFRDLLVPTWCLPLMALGGGPAASAARFDCSRPSVQRGASPWRWSIDRGPALVAEGQKGAPEGLGAEPRFSSWNDTVRFFEDRPARFRLRGRSDRSDRHGSPTKDADLGAVEVVETSEAEATAPEVWPMRVEVLDASLVAALLGLELSQMSPLHSAWLHADLALVAETGEVRVPDGFPAPG